ncbi:MAG: serine/threonine-protein kinase [Isosphaeraceae bacterium]
MARDRSPALGVLNMSQRLNLSCPRGHRWVIDAEVLLATTHPSSFCPDCGEAGSREVRPDPSAGADLAGELPPPPRPLPAVPIADLTASFRSLGIGTTRRTVTETPATVPGYEILGELGRGGMGVVYQARQVSLDREVALKMVLVGAHAGPDDRARFRAEAEAAAHLKHPNVVQVFEVGEYDGLPFLALELVEGGSLATRLAESPLAAEQAAQLVEILAAAMQNAHRRGVIHRDLKPANVLMTPDGTPKITDFGLAKRLDTESGLTKSGAVMGTPSYMAPEQARGQPRAVGPAADIYALGAILYETLTGRPPFHAATPHETIQQVLTEEPVPPSRLQPRVPRDLETICLKCLQKEPERRYLDAGALAEDLHRFLVRVPISARPIPSWERVAKWAQRRPAVAALISVSVMAAVTLVVMGLAYNARLLRQRNIAETQRDLAKKAQAQAEADFRLALGAVKRFYTDISENRLLTVPGMDQVRIELLRRARDFYEQIARDRPDDPDVQAELGRATFRLAAMIRDAGSVPEGIDLMTQAIAVQERLVSQFPNRLEYRSDLARSYYNLGSLHRSNNHRELGREPWLRSLALREQMVREHPDDFLARRDLAQSLHGLGNYYREEGNQGALAEDAYLRAAAIQDGLSREIPAPAQSTTRRPLTPFVLAPDRVRYDLAFTHLNLAILYRDENRLTEAIASFQKALEIVGRQVREYPERNAARRLLAKTKYELGLAHLATKDFTRAEATWIGARDDQQVLVRDFPNDATYDFDLALTLAGLSVISDAKGRASEAEAARRTAGEIVVRMVKTHPETNAFYLEAAGIYALASAVDTRGLQDPTDRDIFSKECSQHAFSMLAEAERTGYFRTASGLMFLKAWHPLDSLREQDEFRRLLDRASAGVDRDAK